MIKLLDLPDDILLRLLTPVNKASYERLKPHEAGLHI